MDTGNYHATGKLCSGNGAIEICCNSASSYFLFYSAHCGTMGKVHGESTFSKNRDDRDLLFSSGQAKIQGESPLAFCVEVLVFLRDAKNNLMVVPDNKFRGFRCSRIMAKSSFRRVSGKDDLQFILLNHCKIHHCENQAKNEVSRCILLWSSNCLLIS